MSEKLKNLSGKEVIKIFLTYGAFQKRTTGSHVRLVYLREEGEYHITVPLHQEIKKGTLRSITKDFEICFGSDAMRQEFYHK